MVLYSKFAYESQFLGEKNDLKIKYLVAEILSKTLYNSFWDTLYGLTASTVQSTTIPKFVTHNPKGGLPLSPGQSSSILRMVGNNLQDGHHNPKNSHLVSQGWSTNTHIMFTHHPQDSHPPPQRWSTTLSCTSFVVTMTFCCLNISQETK